MVEEQRILQAETKSSQHAKWSGGRLSCSATSEYSTVQFFHSSAVILENPDDIFLGKRPT